VVNHVVVMVVVMVVHDARLGSAEGAQQQPYGDCAQDPSLHKYPSGWW
jgi:hypothetical protein